jgi:hypothetical protein
MGAHDIKTDPLTGDTTGADLQRRQFMVGSLLASGGLAIGFQIPFAAHAQTQEIPPEVNAWVVVKPDETVVIRIARSEMGQGTLTGLAQLVAEELECDWGRVTTEYPTPGQNVARKRVWGNMSTGGSRGIRESQEYVRKGGAAARIMLVQAAANTWKVPVSECSVDRGIIAHTPTGRRLSYGQVAGAAAQLTPPTDIALKDPKTWKLAGQPLSRLDTVDKLNGRQVYGADLKLPGMLNAAIKDCPIFGGTVKAVDEAKALAMPGVKRVVRVGNSAVAVVADTFNNRLALWRVRDGTVVRHVGSEGAALGQFCLPSAVTVVPARSTGTDEAWLVVGDSSNHRVQVLTRTGTVVRVLQGDAVIRFDGGGAGDGREEPSCGFVAYRGRCRVACGVRKGQGVGRGAVQWTMGFGGVEPWCALGGGQGQRSVVPVPRS